MTDAYRQKLLNWFSSMLVIWASIASSIAIFWMVTFPEIAPNLDSHEYPGALVVALAMALPVQMLIMPLAFAWHLADFLQVPSAEQFRLKSLENYGLFFLIVASTSMINLMIGSGQFSIIGCPSYPEDFSPPFWEPCPQGPPSWLGALYVGHLMILAFVCMGKALICLYSRMKRVQ